MLLTVINYAQLKGVPAPTVYGYLKAGLMRYYLIDGYKFIDDSEPLPDTVYGRPRRSYEDGSDNKDIINDLLE